jgi:hypothetical protein
VLMDAENRVVDEDEWAALESALGSSDSEVAQPFSASYDRNPSSSSKPQTATVESVPVPQAATVELDGQDIGWLDDD